MLKVRKKGGESSIRWAVKPNRPTFPSTPDPVESFSPAAPYICLADVFLNFMARVFLLARSPGKLPQEPG